MEVYLQDLNVGSFQKETQKTHPASNFSLPFPELGQGWEEGPWSAGPVLSVIHSSVPTSK